MLYKLRNKQKDYFISHETPFSSNLPGLAADLSSNSADLGNMSDAVPVSVKDTQILKLRAAVKAARKTVDDHILEVGLHIADLEGAKENPDIPKNMLYAFSRQLKVMIDRGDILLKDFESKIHT